MTETEATIAAANVRGSTSRSESRTLAWILGATVVPALVIVGMMVARDEPAPAAPTPAASVGQQSTAPSAVSTPSPELSALLAALDLKPEEFVATFKPASKQCFGAAGCNVTGQVELSLAENRLTGFDRSQTWTIAYMVTGDRSGPILSTVTLAADGSYGGSLLDFRTASDATHIVARVTAVVPN